MIRTLTLALSLLVLSASAAAAQWREAIRTAIDRDTWRWQQDGYAETDVWTGTLYDGDDTDLYVTLAGGVSYRFVGKCDENCSDLDFGLYYANGNSISTDLESDATPVVVVTPRWTGRFRLRVTMASCDADYCGYGVGMFVR
ncbi:hypothetical protein [Longimicrobium sp.]|uniref:hypothetical protein n=1 Tax=Longimicrobium sp. TaxID=2029185 RepID=UPI002C517E0A|nr:hypothetical protein [Longimicrobium sp.]HSU12903.1 hypothetical protein [Longimicrobium sp.]